MTKTHGPMLPIRRLALAALVATVVFGRPAHAEYRQIDLTVFGMD